MTAVTQTVAKPADQGATTATPDLATLKIRDQAAWSSGDYAVVGTTLRSLPRSFAKLPMSRRTGKCWT
jgi:hypothetical protein